MEKYHEVHYTPNTKGKAIPAKSQCGQVNPFAWSNHKNEVTCGRCIKIEGK
jgi:ribosomal protein S27AE